MKRVWDAHAPHPETNGIGAFKFKALSPAFNLVSPHPSLQAITAVAIDASIKFLQNVSP